MKRLALALILASSPVVAAPAARARAAKTAHAKQTGNAPDAARWEQEARDVTIMRDDWGIAHVYGKTDADAVFGTIYAQAEDDFNRVETNYINALGRLAEAEGESRIYRDLRMKLFMDPETVQKRLRGEPGVAEKIDERLGRRPELLPR
jgi:acyl-homoserine-lactone acylase